MRLVRWSACAGAGVLCSSQPPRGRERRSRRRGDRTLGEKGGEDPAHPLQVIGGMCCTHDQLPGGQVRLHLLRRLAPDADWRVVGERIIALCAAEIKCVTLELGGSDPMIICDDAEISKAASAAAWAGSTTAGSPVWRSRVYASESVTDQVIEAIVTKSVMVGP